ncbi:MAG: CPBP family intramembrane metalloprotease [Verrucomicrobia bacterium]|nr:CPBP family intramembrane metalloprotease [Verrucomicrobiota bacterium]
MQDPTDNRKTWLVVLPAMTLPFLASLFYFVFWSEQILARWLYGFTKLFTLVWPVIAVLLITKADLPRFKLSDELHRRALPWGILAGIGIIGVMWIIMLTPLREMILGCAPRIRSKAQALGMLDYYWTFGLFLSLIHSLLEEYYWRWFVYGQLRRVVGNGFAHVLAGVSFAAHHLVVTTQYFPPVWGVVFGALTGAGGILWSVLYEKQRTLAGAWICHVLVDLGILSIGHKLLFGSYF